MKMEEKLIIKSERYNLKVFLIIIIIIGGLTSCILFANIDGVSRKAKWYDEHHETYLEHQNSGYHTTHSYDDCPDCEMIKAHPIKLLYLIDYAWELFFDETMHALIPFGVSILISIFAFVWLRSELIVTDKRVYGKATFGRRVDLPVDSVTAISTGIFKGVGVGTSSGKINFKLIKNRDEIHSVISNLLLERQKDNKERTETQAVNFTNADEIKKYKELLENGTITQEEFDAKKKQLLGL